MSLIFVDCEAYGGCPALGELTEFGAVAWDSRETFYGDLRDATQEEAVFAAFRDWLAAHSKGRPVFVSDNPAFDWQWINDGFLRTQGANPFGHSARRISDFYAGVCGDFYKTQQWKGWRKTPHDHNPVNDAMGNVEAFEKILELVKGKKG
jgi:hypothetical protein